MIWRDYQLEEEISKTTETMTLWKAERGFVEIDRDALIVGVKQDDKQKGYVFHGHGKLLLDTIVETEEGAVGRSVERQLNEPFLMLADAEELKHVEKAAEDDLRRMGYDNEQGFFTAAKGLLEKTLAHGRLHQGDCCGHQEGSIFAFPNDKDRPDVLMCNGSRIVYATGSMVFVANGNKTILKNPEQVILSKHGRSFIINS